MAGKLKNILVASQAIRQNANPRTIEHELMINEQNKIAREKLAKESGGEGLAALALLPPVETDRYTFNMEEFKRAENITSTQMEKDVREEGELHKYMIQAMNKPDSLPNWN